MSGDIDVELDSVETETGQHLKVYISGRIGSDELFMEVGTHCVELSAKQLAAATAYADYT